MTEADADAFESAHHIRLPSDYRWFLTNIGNGGAGPYYGIFPLGKTDDFSSTKRWQEGDGFIGHLAEPFPFTEPWNDLSAMPPDDLVESDESLYAELSREFEQSYFFAVNGAIPICHIGCAIRIWLVVSGPESGNLWCDDRANDGGFQPIVEGGTARLQFLPWYRKWLDEALNPYP